MKYCPYCGEEIKEGFKVCPYCGEQLSIYNADKMDSENNPSKLICPHCGSDNIQVQIVSETKSTGCLMILFYLVLAITIIGIPIMILILLLKGKKSITRKHYICQNCGTSFTPNATNHIKNNNKRPKSIGYKIIRIILIIFGSLLIIYGSGELYRSIQKYTSTNSNQDKIMTSSVGELFKCGNFEITVDKVQIKKKGTSIDSYTEITDPEWIGVTLSIKNFSNETKTFYTSNVKLTNSNGEILEHSIWTYEIWGTKLLNSPELVPGGNKTGYIQFTNNNMDNSNLSLIIDCNKGLFSENTKYKINISQ